MSDIEPGMIQTFENVEEELIDTEALIYNSMGLLSFRLTRLELRKILRDKWKANELEETELVSRWLELLSVYNDMIRYRDKVNSD